MPTDLSAHNSIIELLSKRIGQDPELQDITEEEILKLVDILYQVRSSKNPNQSRKKIKDHINNIAIRLVKDR